MKFPLAPVVLCLSWACSSGLAGSALAAPPLARSPLTASDLAALRDVAEPRLAPDGLHVAFTVTEADIVGDRRRTTLWVAPLNGTAAYALSAVPDDVSTIHWAPDSQTIAYLSSQGGSGDRNQLWFVDATTQRRWPASAVVGNVTDFAFAPDGRAIVLVVQAPVPSKMVAAPDGLPIVPPIVVDRYYFKEDVSGYLGQERQHLFLLEISTGTVRPLTDGPYDEAKPSWAPDSKAIAFVSKRGGDPDRHSTFGIFVLDVPSRDPGSAAVASQGAARLVASYEGTTYQGDAASDWARAPAWSPDAKTLAFVSAGDPHLIYYSVHQLALVPAAGGAVRLVSPALDRNVSYPRWSNDGHAVLALVEDDGNSHLTRFDIETGIRTTLLEGRHSTLDYDYIPGAAIAVLDSTPAEPAEVYALIEGQRRNLSQQNAALLARRKLAQVDEFAWKSADGTAVHGFLTKPPGFVPGRAYPTILHLHGGPTSQFDNGFDFEQQLLAAQGYLVVAPNPRGSAGRGEAFASAIYADWGVKDSADVVAAIDTLVSSGISDPRRLGIGGWSYGGMLTNYVIARDTRFAAAVSGASLANMLAAYGTDMYVREYEAELGPPWKNLAGWLKVSFPFLEAEHILTPTLFLCGTLDYSVPLLHSEQIYQAMRSLGRDTMLVVYPGQSHSFVRPSFRRDRLERYIDWYARYLLPARAAVLNPGS